MKFSEQIFGGKEDEAEEGTEQEKLVSRVKKAINYKLRGEECDVILLEFCSRVGEPFPKNKKDRAALIAKLEDPAFLETIKNLTVSDLEVHRAELNDFVSVSYENPAVVLLHVGRISHEGGQTTLEQFKDGMTRLAKLLTSDTRLANVKTIGALSWLVSQHPRVLERFGFSIGPLKNILDGEVIERKYRSIVESFPTFIPPEYKKTELGFASISREEFLRRYGGQ